MNLKVNFDKVVGRIKPMHGVGQPPFQGTDFSMFSYLKEAGIPFSRLHDVGGVYGENRWVDIPNLFRHFDADPYDPASYDFTFTDLLVKALMEVGCEPFFRLGVTIENDAKIRSYRLDPPQDFHKWAVICEHVIRHYTEGWADGFTYPIRYWEIWNEPDNYENPEENQMWRGTKEQYYELYGVASKHLKKCFPHLKIGGYASCGFYALRSSFVATANSSPRYDYFIEFLDGFLAYVKKEHCPLDFFSWHSYDGIQNNCHYARYARRRLDEIGLTETEITCNEWNAEVKKRGTYLHAATACGMLLAFQDLPLDSAMFYDARLGTSVYGSLFHPLTRKPFPTYDAFVAFHELYRRGEEVELLLSEDAPLYAVAAKQGRDGCIVIANPSGEDVPLSLEMNARLLHVRTVGEGASQEENALPAVLPKESFLTVFAEL